MTARTVILLVGPEGPHRQALEQGLRAAGLALCTVPEDADLFVVDTADPRAAGKALRSAGTRPVVVLIGPDTTAQAWESSLGPNAELAWRSQPPERLAARVARVASSRQHSRVLERAHELQAQVTELAGRLDPTVPATTLLNLVGESLMRVEGIVGVFGALGGPEASRALEPILTGGFESRPTPHQVRTALTEPGPRWHTEVGGGEGAHALCVIPLGQGPLGLLSIRLSPPEALPTAAAESLGMLLGRACAASLLVSSAKERQVRLERGYLARVRELRRLTSTVDRLSEIRDDFLAVLSHDLRSPLSIIQGNCQILSEGLVGEVNPRQLKTVATVSRQATRMTDMVEDLLDRFRAGSTPTPHQAEQVSLGEVARHIQETHADAAAEREVTLEVAEPSSCSVLSDPSVLRQVLGNLVDNAIKHSPGGDVVTLTVYATGTDVGIEVRDRGPGFPEGGPDLTGPVAPREHGMGLKLCDRMMRMSGGALEFKNHPEGGAVARMSLPPTTADSRAQRLLVGSGELDRLEDLTERLGMHWDVTGLTHGESLVEQIRQSPPDVLVLDQTLLGRMNGLTLLGELKGDAELGTVPVILLVPGGQPGLAEQAHNLGALSVLGLPLDHEELEAQIGRAVRLSGESASGFATQAHDPLTGLDTVGNQEGRLQRLQQESREAGLPLAGLLIDVSELKAINVKHGYAAGDQLILWLSTQLRKLTRPGELLLRLRSDEFLLVRPRAGLEETLRAAEELARSVRDAKPRIGATRMRVSVDVQVQDLAPLESLENLHYADSPRPSADRDVDGA